MSQCNSGLDKSSVRQPNAFFATVSITTQFLPFPALFHCHKLKPGKTLPVVSLSQEKKSGTSIQMITELGKLSLCPLLPFVPSLRRSAPHQLVLICLAAVKALTAPMASLWTHFYSSFWLKLTVLFWPLFNDFFFSFWGIFSPSNCVCRASLGFWSCSVCPCGCFHSNPQPLPPPNRHAHTHALLPSSVFWPRPVCISPLSLWLTFLFHSAQEAWEEIRYQKQKTHHQTIF